MRKLQIQQNRKNSAMERLKPSESAARALKARQSQGQGQGRTSTAPPAMNLGTLAPANNPPSGNAVQWDMVMPSSHWDDDVVNMDLTWDWQVPPMDPYQQPPEYDGNE